MAPDKVKTSIGTLNYFDGVPTEATAKTVYDYLDRSRAVEVYLNCIPALSVNVWEKVSGSSARCQQSDLHLR